MKVYFREISLPGTKSVKCAGGCGRRLNRQKKFFQTLNPFNKLPDGSLKGIEDIYLELRESIRQWRGEPEFCKNCNLTDAE